MNKQWSQSARDETIRVLASGEFGFTPSGVAFKHIDGRHGIAAIRDLLQDDYRFKDRKTGQVYRYDSPEALVESGWVLD